MIKIKIQNLFNLFQIKRIQSKEYEPNFIDKKFKLKK